MNKSALCNFLAFILLTFAVLLESHERAKLTNNVTQMAANNLEDTKQRIESDKKLVQQLAAARLAIAINEDSLAKLRGEIAELRGRVRQTK